MNSANDRSTLPVNQLTKSRDLEDLQDPDALLAMIPDRMMSTHESEISNENRNTGRIDIFDAAKFKSEAARCILEIKTFICILTETIKRFYRIEKRVKSRCAKEQLENFITS